MSNTKISVTAPGGPGLSSLITRLKELIEKDGGEVNFIVNEYPEGSERSRSFAGEKITIYANHMLWGG